MRPLLLLLLASCATPAPDAVPPADEALRVGAAGPSIERVTTEPIAQPFTRTLPDGSERTFARLLHIEGAGFYGTARGPFVLLDGEELWGVEVRSDTRIVVWLADEAPRRHQLRVVNPDGRDAEASVTF